MHVAAPLPRAVPPWLWPLLQNLVTVIVVAGTVIFTFAQLGPSNILSSTTPAGGDMGAHVWGPAFLRDTLLPEGRITGWSPDWYAGFPAYRFYMVVPALAIVLLDVLLPYGVAFKLVTVAGVLSLPVAAWALGRLARLPFPGPPLLACAAVFFLFDRSFTIYGGNIASTLAGEFSFSISLSLTIVYFGVLIRGLRTGRHRVLAAVLLALVGLCHVIPAFFALAGTAVLFLLQADRRRAIYLGTATITAALLGAFWALPFAWRRGYMTDMGWEKLETYWERLFPGAIGDALARVAGGSVTSDVSGDITWVVVLALVGVGTSIVYGRRLGIFLMVLGLMFAFAFVLAPQGRLWNARLLPFWYLCLYLLAALAIFEVINAVATLVANRPDFPVRPVLLGGTILAFLATLITVALPLRSLPGGSLSADGATYSWAFLETTDNSFVRSWARWNFTGYEGKEAWPEYSAVVSTMEQIGEDNGCGRAMWEHREENDRYGTPMALMLLPYWTDGCIGSMEGLYFESSATTPFHFLTVAEVSQEASNPQRDLPYRPLSMDEGVEHLQLLGVRYYMAGSDEAKAAAEDHPALTPLDSSGPWQIYEVADSALVEGLEFQPAVATDADSTGRGWQDLAVEFYQDSTKWDVPLATEGPALWPRTQGVLGEVDALPLEAVEPAIVSAIEATSDTISFDVDQIGTPVLVKTSYFPNWKVDGAEGPYRVTPNQMVVIPTDTHVELRYASTPIDWLGWALTLLGLAALGLMIRGGPVALPDPMRRRQRWAIATAANLPDFDDSEIGEEWMYETSRDGEGDRELQLESVFSGEGEDDDFERWLRMDSPRE